MHGDPSGSVDRHHNLVGSRLLEPDAERVIRPERIMNELKSYASRALNQWTSEGPDRKRWAPHGSTRWLWKDEDVRHALQYGIDKQGEPMALFVADDL